MENKLKKLFDYQRFSANPELNAVIQELERRHHIEGQGMLLSDDELLNVAGGKAQSKVPPKKTQ